MVLQTPLTNGYGVEGTKIASGLTLPDYGHMWHLDSFGTQFSNGILSIAVNGLCLSQVWCNPARVPPWAFDNADGLLLALNSLQAAPKNLSLKDCFPSGIDLSMIGDLSPSYSQPNKFSVELTSVCVTSPSTTKEHISTKKQKLVYSPKNSSPLHLTNFNHYGPKTKYFDRYN